MPKVPQTGHGHSVPEGQNNLFKITPKTIKETEAFYQNCLNQLSAYYSEYVTHTMPLPKDLNMRDRITETFGVGRHSQIIEAQEDPLVKEAVNRILRAPAQNTTAMYLQNQLLTKPWLKEKFIQDISYHLQEIRKYGLDDLSLGDTAKDLLSLTTCSKQEFDNVMVLYNKLENDYYNRMDAEMEQIEKSLGYDKLPITEEQRKRGFTKTEYDAVLQKMSDQSAEVIVKSKIFTSEDPPSISDVVKMVKGGKTAPSSKKRQGAPSNGVQNIQDFRSDKFKPREHRTSRGTGEGNSNATPRADANTKAERDAALRPEETPKGKKEAKKRDEIKKGKRKGGK